MVAQTLARQDDIQVLSVKDYIAQPKPNGYRSYHIIVQVPVFFCEKKEAMRVEIQLRTVAMDFWATLEHQMKYKNASADSAEMVDALRSCADYHRRNGPADAAAPGVHQPPPAAG